MLHDAARKGDVEIPVFCYEPKLGDPVGACRMCLVEIEGIPKLQTSCSTPVRDGHGRPHPHRAGQGGAERGGRVPARQPPARLPRLRQRRRVPAAGHHAGLGPGQEPGDRRKAPLPEADRTLAAGRDRPRALHPLLPLRPLQPGGRRGRAAAAARARRPHLRRHLRRPPLRRPLPRQHHRPLPGRRADQLHLPLPRPALGHRAGRLGLHALPEPVQRQLHRPRREGETGAGPRQRRGRRRLALRPRPLRLRDVRRRGAGRRAAAARRRRGRLGGGDREAAAAGLRRGRRQRSRRSSATPPTRRATWSSGSLREALGSPHVDSRPSRGPAREALVRLAQPERLGQGPRHRRRRRDPRPRHRPAAQLADPRPADPQGDPPQRRPAGRRDRAPDRARRRRRGDRPLRPRRGRPLPRRAGRGAAAAPRTSPRRWPRRLRDAGKVVVVWGERIGREGDAAASALLDLAAALEHRRHRGRRPARSPRRRQRPRPARGRLPPRRRPGLWPRPPRGNVDRGDPRRRWSRRRARRR